MWAQGNAPLCASHARRWSGLGKPDLDEYARSYHDVIPDHERLDLRGLPGLKLEMQYAMQCRDDDAKIKTPPSRVRHVVCFVARSGVRSLLDWPEEAWRERLRVARRVRAARSVAPTGGPVETGTVWQSPRSALMDRFPRSEGRLRALSRLKGLS